MSHAPSPTRRGDVPNPYWDIIAALPPDPVLGAYHQPGFLGGPRPFDPEHPEAPHRWSLAPVYAWAIPSPTDLEFIADVLAGRPLLDLGAGTGYWAHLLDAVGIDVLAVDRDPPHLAENTWHHGADGAPAPTYHPVHAGTEEVLDDHPDRVLFLCWPPYQWPFADIALARYTGDTFLFCGEPANGCTADEAFYYRLEAEWTETAHSPGHVSWAGIHDHLIAYTRRAPRGRDYLRPTTTTPARALYERLHARLRAEHEETP